MDQGTREFVRRRANNRCEYCQLPQEACLLTFHVDHIIAKQHLDQVDDDPKFLCLDCNRCNFHKGTNLSSIDPRTQKQVSLYNPRKGEWKKHFEVHDGEIIGLTPTGRATVRLLDMNNPKRVTLRKLWLASKRP